MQVEKLLDKSRKFLEETYYSKMLENKRQGKKRVTIEYDELARYDPEFAEELIITPEETLTTMELAAKDLIEEGMHVRVRGEIPNSKYRIRDLRSNHLNKFITIEGTIETKTDVSSVMASVVYECPSCGNTINILQMGDTLKEPIKCGCGRKGKFKIISKEIMDAFTIRLQELSSSIKYGSDMKVISVICKADLTDTIIEEKLIEGIKVKINGIYKERMLLRKGIAKTTLITFIDANYIQLFDETFYDIELNQEDIAEIKEFSKQPNLINNIYEGMFSGIYGYSKIKEALTLQAFGGVSNYESIPPIRGEAHILLVGDPGESKSVFCDFACKYTPKSVLVVGKSVSAVGLSGATIKDEITGAFVLKPGAIPLANNGLISIDELDKMKEEDRDILHEPMEQQRISISKANLPDRKMLARASFLVSMNPKFSYFVEDKEIYEQIGLPATLINRFDLVYIMKKNRNKDDKAKEFEREKAKTMMVRGRQEHQQELKNFHKFMRKYIAYARQNIFPTFDRYLEEEYIPDTFAGFDHDRKPSAYDEHKQRFPITPRHIWIIRRLAEARARIFLRSKCVVEDVDYAIDKIRDSLEDIAIDKSTGQIDEEYVVDGVSSKKKKIINIFDEVCSEVEDEHGIVNENKFIVKMKEQGIEEREIDAFLQRMSSIGEIFYIRLSGDRAFKKNNG